MKKEVALAYQRQKEIIGAQQRVGILGLACFVLMALPAVSEAVVTGLADNKLDFERVAPQSIASDPCDGSVLSVINRPTFGDTPCTVPEDMFLVEGGFSHFKYTENGTGYSLPQLEMRYGLPYENEIGFHFPNYVKQTENPETAGAGPFSFTFKHEMFRFEEGVFSLEALAIAPSGSAEFGAAKGGFMLNGIVAYDLTPELTLSGMLGMGAQSQTSSQGGASYFTVNPYMEVSWRPFTQWQFFGEVTGQSSMGPGQGVGMLFDGGIQYLFTNYVEFDVEGGTKLTNQFLGIDNYVGFGMAVLF